MLSKKQKEKTKMRRMKISHICSSLTVTKSPQTLKNAPNTKSSMLKPPSTLCISPRPCSESSLLHDVQVRCLGTGTRWSWPSFHPMDSDWRRAQETKPCVFGICPQKLHNSNARLTLNGSWLCLGLPMAPKLHLVTKLGPLPFGTRPLASKSAERWLDTSSSSLPWRGSLCTLMANADGWLARQRTGTSGCGTLWQVDAWWQWHHIRWT